MSGEDTSGLFDRPVLTLDPGFHTAPIKCADVDAAGQIAVTGSHDGTVRVWLLADGSLKRTIRLPKGSGNIGKVFAVALSPDGNWIAAGGWTRASEADPQEQIYIFSAVSGMMRQRIEGLPEVVNHLTFSPASDRLAVGLGGKNGIRFYARDGADKWAEVAADTDYGDQSYGPGFAHDGRFATTSFDGRLRLYDADGGFLRSVATLHARPFGLAFSPVDGRLAVGFEDATAVSTFDGETLAPLPSPDVRGIDNGNLSIVAWSADGATLFAAGRYEDGSGAPVVARDDGGAGPGRTLPAGTNSVTSLQPLPDGALLVSAADPWLGVLEADGGPRWVEVPRQIDTRDQWSNFAVSQDGMRVVFGPKPFGTKDRLCFDLAALQLLSAGENGRIAPPMQDSLAIADWINSTKPTLDGKALPLLLHETARSLAIDPDGDRFILGTDRLLRAFDVAGKTLWWRPVQGAVWAVNISGDGRLAVAACGDGTIRWYRMEDGVELLALFPMLDGENWVAWTPEGIYAATPGARSILRWHVNRGWDRAAEAIPVSEIPETHRPEVIRHVLPQMGAAGALAVTELAKIRGAVRRATGSDVTPGARLHVLTIGVSDYGEAARHLNLVYADRDAHDVAAALRRSQCGLYAEVRAIVLVNEEASKTAIFAGLEQIRTGMAAGGGADLALIQFSGHGDMVDGKFYLLPHGIDDGSAAAVKANGLPAVQFHDEIAAIARHGRVIVLVDACRSGGATSLPDRSLRAMLTGANVTVFTSCAQGQLSEEGMEWENGAFTEALLEALGGAADYDHDGIIGLSDLARRLGEHVPALTGGAQRPEVEIRGSDVRIFAVALWVEPDRTFHVCMT